MADQASRIKSADRTVELLELLAEISDRRTLVELSRDLGIPKSSMHGLLRTLVRRGWVETDSSGSRYGLGVHALRTGTAYLRTDRATRRLTPAIEHLHARLGTTVQLARLVGGHMVGLMTREVAHVRPMLRSGWPVPAHTTAIGRAVLARVADDDSALADLLPAAVLSSPAFGELRDELRRTADRGHAVDWEPTGREVGCGIAVAAPPILAPLDAVGVCAREGRLTAARATELAAQATAAIAAGMMGAL